MSIISNIFSYQDLKDRNQFQGDQYGIASHLSEVRRNTFLNNPNLKDYSKCAMYLTTVDRVIVGRMMFFPIEFCNNEKICEALSASALEVHEDYRHLAVGADLIMYPILSKDREFLIYSGISPQALPLYKKLKFYILEFPRMMQIRNTRCIIESLGIQDKLLNFLSSITNIPLLLLIKFGFIASKKRGNKYSIEKVKVIPDWIDEISVHDGHKYMEVHDRKWLQWNLDYNFSGLTKDKQLFYTIKKGDIPIGFLMIKERFREKAGSKLKNITIGSIVEWGSKDENILNESDINIIALSLFSKDVDIVEFATSDQTTIKSMRKYGFIHYGDAHIAFKDLNKKCKDANDISLWRIRYGYADVILT